MSGLYRLFNIILRCFFWIFYRVKPHGRENLPDGAALICANHSSNDDAVILAFACGMNYFMRFMAKIELRSVPVVGGALAKIGTIFVDRGKSDLGAVKTAMQTLKDGGRVAIFPEGRRVRAGEEGDVKTGAVMLASKTGVPVVPVYIPKKKHHGQRLDVYIGKPYYIERMRGSAAYYDDQAAELMERIADLAPEAKAV